MSRLRQANGDDYPEAAGKHMQDSGALLARGRYDGAAYLAGYVVECALKTLIQLEAGQVGHHHDLSRLDRDLDSLAAQASSLAGRLYLGVQAAWVRLFLVLRHPDSGRKPRRRMQVRCRGEGRRPCDGCSDDEFLGAAFGAREMTDPRGRAGEASGDDPATIAAWPIPGIVVFAGPGFSENTCAIWCSRRGLSGWWSAACSSPARRGAWRRGTAGSAGTTRPGRGISSTWAVAHEDLHGWLALFFGLADGDSE